MKIEATALIIIAVLFIASGFIPPQKRAATAETEVKAVFLFNFAQFVEWPPEVLRPTDSAIVIGVLGKDPFGLYLEEIVKGESVNGHPLVVERYTSVKEIQNCHILFINPGRTIKVENVLKSLRTKSILTVSDAPNFTKQGGMIRFINEDNKIKLEINLGAVRESNISISSKLLSLSDIID